MVFFVIFGIGAYIFINLYSALNSSLIKTYILDSGEISNTISKKILIIRQEHPIQSPATGYISYHAQEGDRLRKDGVIGKIQNQELKGDEHINLQIINRRMNELRGGVASVDPEGEMQQIDRRLDFLISDIQNRIKEEDFSYIPALKNEFISLVERKKLIQGASTLGNLTLEQLQEKKTEIENRINADKYYIRTANAGILSFYYDEQYQRFSPENISKLTVKDIDDFTDQNRIERRDRIREGDIIGTVVGNHRWYFICEVTKEDIQKIERGKSLRCFMGEETIQVVLEDFFKGADGKFIGIFQVENENVDFTGKRKQEAKIEYKRSHGLMVKKNSVTTYKEKRGIFVVNEVGVAEFRELPEVFGENEDYYSIAYNPEIFQKTKGINLYEEIVSYPEGVREGQSVR